MWIETSQLFQVQISWSHRNGVHVWCHILFNWFGAELWVNTGYHPLRKCKQLNGLFFQVLGISSLARAFWQRAEKRGRKAWPLRAGLHPGLGRAGNCPDKRPWLHVPARCAPRENQAQLCFEIKACVVSLLLFFQESYCSNSCVQYCRKSI